MKNYELIVSSLLKRKIAYFLQKNFYRKDNCLVSVTDVRLSGDLKAAKVYVHTIGDNKNFKKDVLADLNKLRYDVQKSISKNTRLKYTPIIKFIDDNNNIDKKNKVLSIIDNFDKQDSE